MSAYTEFGVARTQYDPTSLLEVDSSNLPIIEFNVATPLNHWSEHGDLPPNQAIHRVRRLELYGDLYDGDHSSLLRPFRRNVRVNYFSKVADYYADTLTFTPPTFTPRLDEKLYTKVIEALYGVVLDIIRYGTGIFYAYPGKDGEPTVINVNPVSWFPAPYDQGDVFAVHDPSVDEMQLWILLPNLTRYQRYEINGASLGRLLESRDFGKTTNDRLVVPCYQLPKSGEWGKAMYFNMIPLVQELSIRLTGMAEILDNHINPVLALKRDPRFEDYNHNPLGDTQAIEVIEQQRNLFGMRHSNTVVMPSEYSDAHYIQYDPQWQALSFQVKEVESKLFDVTRCPIALSGDFQPITASGAALKRLYSDTYIHLGNLQTMLKPKLKEVARLLTGRDHRVTWDNPFNVLDRQEIIQGSPSDIQGLEGGSASESLRNAQQGTNEASEG